MSARGEARSIAQLLADLARESTTLLRKEIELIKAELAEKLAQLQIGVGSIAAGAICMLVALNVLVGALVIALAHLIGPGWSALVVGVAIAAVGAFLLKKGASDLNPSKLAPDRSVQQVKEDVQLVKEQMQ